MSRRDSWAWWGAGIAGLLAILSAKKPAAPKPKAPTGSGAAGAGIGDGDVIQYFVDGQGQVMIHTASPQVEWGTPKLAPTAATAFRSMVTTWKDLVEEASVDYRVPAAWIYAVMHAESGGDPKATSPAGALGLMQVMPMHFKPGESPLDPRTNIRRGASILQAARAKGPDIVQSASIYNAGMPPDGKGPWTNAVWLAHGRTPADTTRWGFAAEPNYLDHVVAANNTYVTDPVA